MLKKTELCENFEIRPDFQLQNCSADLNRYQNPDQISKSVENSDKSEYEILELQQPSPCATQDSDMQMADFQEIFFWTAKFVDR